MTQTQQNPLAFDGPLDRAALAIATLGPVGRLPVAPGTWGSAVALLLAPWVFIPLPLLWRCGVLALILAIGAWAAARTEIILGEEDPGCVVVDDFWANGRPLRRFTSSQASPAGRPAPLGNCSRCSLCSASSTSSSPGPSAPWRRAFRAAWASCSTIWWPGFSAAAVFVPIRLFW